MTYFIVHASRTVIERADLRLSANDANAAEILGAAALRNHPDFWTWEPVEDPGEGHIFSVEEEEEEPEARITIKFDSIFPDCGDTRKDSDLATHAGCAGTYQATDDDTIYVCRCICHCPS